MTRSKFSFFTLFRNQILIDEFKSVIKSLFINKYALAVIIIIFFLNITSLVPYIFSITSHPFVTFEITILIITPIICIVFFFNIKSTLVHLTPFGRTTRLIFFLVPIEFISLIIRPLTLRLRIMANIIAGHIILSLIGSFVEHTNFNPIIPLLFFFNIIEIAVAIIQSYVFTLLILLYLKETT